MKQIELELKKRLLIVEGDMLEFKLNDKRWLNDQLFKICKGSELTEEIAKMFFRYEKLNNQYEYDFDTDYIGLITKRRGSAFDLFTSAIEEQGYYWENNTAKTPYSTSMGFDEWDENGLIYADVLNFQDAKNKTFHPGKTLIFEIL